MGSSGETVLAAARELAPHIRARAGEVEAARRVPADLAAQLADAGVFTLCVPGNLGGPAAAPWCVIQVIEAISRADASVGWCVMIGATTSTLAPIVSEEWGRTIFGGGRPVITGGVAVPYGTARPVDGGFVVDGHWSWGSNTINCEWIVAGCRVVGDDGEARRSERGAPELRLTFLERQQVNILDTWYATGLRGDASNDFEVRGAFVPEGRTTMMGVSRPRSPEPLYAFPLFGLLALGVSAVALGNARRAIDEFVELAPRKTPNWSSRPLAERPTVAAAVSEAEAIVRSSRAFVAETVAAAWDAAQLGQRLSIDHKRDLRLAATSAVQRSAQAVEIVYRAAGGHAVYESSVLQRCFRDANVITQHGMVQPSTLELTGRLLLGLETDTFGL